MTSDNIMSSDDFHKMFDESIDEATKKDEGYTTEKLKPLKEKHTPQDDDDYDKKKPNESAILLKQMHERQELNTLFIDKHGIAFAAVMIEDHRETLPIKSSRFRLWICKRYFDMNEQPIKAETLKQLTDLLEAQALFSNIVRDLRVRVSSDNTNMSANKTYYYDLTNKHWHVVRIDQHDWFIEPSTQVPIIFKRHSNQLEQVIPSKDYPPDIFDRFMDLINIKDDSNKLLLKCYIISLFIPDIPKPVLILYGEQGSAKSTLQELIKKIIDPSSIINLTFPRDINELVQQLSHNYIAYYDNVSFIRDWISDQICRAVTGSGFSKRELYSDDDDIIYNFKRCIGINGINLAATKADLLDRSIIIQLERISKEDRRKIQDILSKLELIKPKLLGYIFDIIVKTIQVILKGGLDLGSKSRMADFEEYAEIISRCMGHKDNEFIEAYRENQKLQTDAVIEGSPVALAVVKLIEQNIEWSGTATELIKEFESIADGITINTTAKHWPKSPGSLTRRLNEVRTNLREVGISVEYDKSTDTKRTRIIKICKISSNASNASEKKNSLLFESKNLDDTSKSSDDTDQISSNNIVQNPSQNQQLDDMDDMDDIIRISPDPEVVKVPEYLKNLTEAVDKK